MRLELTVCYPHSSTPHIPLIDENVRSFATLHSITRHNLVYRFLIHNIVVRSYLYSHWNGQEKIQEDHPS